MKPGQSRSPLALILGITEKLNSFLENRDQRQKNMIVGALFALILLLDFVVLIRPVIGMFTETIPKLSSQREKLRNMQDDMKNAGVIDKQWQEAREKLAETEKQFIAKNELPSLLENLSKLAQNSQFKIITLKPLETRDAGSGLVRIPIHMSAVAGTHDLGRFLAQLEGGPICFKVLDLRITANGSDERRQIIDLSIETYAKIK